MIDHPRPDLARLKARNREPRSVERLLTHFRLESELAARLRHASREERPVLYQQLYDTLFASLPDHPQNTKTRDAGSDRIAEQRDMLLALLPSRGTYLEIGCGDAALTFAMASHCTTAYGVDVTDRLIDRAVAPANFGFVRTSGVAIDLPDASVDLAYSNQLTEHLHPNDVTEQVREIHRVLRPGGAYLCRTPSRLTGPHEISVYFAYEAQAFHWREHVYRDLARLFRAVCFRKLRAILHARGRQVLLPVGLLTQLESSILAMPNTLRQRILDVSTVWHGLGVELIGFA